MSNVDKPILLFDGVCNLCHLAVQFVIRHDHKKVFLFAHLQSEYGEKVLGYSLLLPISPSTESVILLDRGRTYTRSGAVLRTFRLLGGLWAILYVFIIIPPFIRNALYGLVARNRYK